MKQSKMFIPTTRATSNDDATSKSLAFMQRAGMIKQIAAGVYTYLPYSMIILNKIQQIIREEMALIDSVELLMPSMQPKELWEKSGRWEKYGKELMRFQDRHERDFCLGPTHEEVIVSVVKDHLTSWRQLPLSLYQIQTKFRDELRPRFGLMRGREFIMKDAYSFHANPQSLDDHFKAMEQAYDQIFTRCSLDIIKVSADNGSIGGSDSTEFMAISDIGEDTLVYCENCGYQANLEKAIAHYDIEEKQELKKDIEKVKTPQKSSVEDVALFLNTPLNKVAKNMLYLDEDQNQIYLVVIPGHYQVNETKLVNLIKANNIRLLSDEEIINNNLVKGFVGLVNLNNKQIKVVIDESLLLLNNIVVGANENDYHFINVNLDDYHYDLKGDLKEVASTDLCHVCQQPLSFAKGIEVGHIFKLGDAYSSKFQAQYLDQDQKKQNIEMGCYGLGVSRLLMAIVERRSFENHIIWPTELVPYDYHIIIVDLKKDDQVSNANLLYHHLIKEGYQVLLDDTNERAGSKFANADLIGASKKIIVGGKASEGLVEISDVKTGIKEEISIATILKEPQAI
ncbi:MAG: proline--tRNA ligase [Bacilli bacterium]